MNGWRYEWVAALPVEVYDIIVEEMTKDLEARAEATGAGAGPGPEWDPGAEF